ncbi:MAG: hypothetical protein KA998_05535, partial [Rickettsiaceae bacterium]|nr:hypothetical protein [Rickettsiaceae bacterium]
EGRKAIIISRTTELNAIDQSMEQERNTQRQGKETEAWNKGAQEVITRREGQAPKKTLIQRMTDKMRRIFSRDTDNFSSIGLITQKPQRQRAAKYKINLNINYPP